MQRLGIIAVLTAAGFAASAPFELPAPTGSAAIGTTTWRVEHANRSIEVHAWYPAARPGREPAPYLRNGPAEVRRFATAIQGPVEAFEAMAGVRTHATLDAPVASSPAGMPLLVFSHGYTAEPSAYTALLEDLSSHGFIVLSVVHAYEPGETDRVFGEWKTEDETMAAVTNSSDEVEQLRLTRGYLAAIPHTTAVLGRWVEDVRGALDSPILNPQSSIRNDLTSRIDRQRIGVFGHSMGGVASAAFCVQDRRCRAGLNLDGIPQYGAVVDGDLHHPFLMVYSARPGRLGASDAVYRRAAPTYYRVDVRDTRHLDFSDMAFWPTLHDRRITGPLPAARAAAIPREVVREFFDQELGGRPSPLLGGARRIAEATVASFRRQPL